MKSVDIECGFYCVISFFLAIALGGGVAASAAVMATLETDCLPSVAT